MSVEPPMRDRRLMWIAIAFAVLLANTAYLAAFVEPSLFYFANVALHVVGGVAVTIAAVAYLLARRPDFTPLLRLAFAVLGVGVVAGLIAAVTGATRPYRWLMDVHILCATCGSILLA